MIILEYNIQEIIIHKLSSISLNTEQHHGLVIFRHLDNIPRTNFSKGIFLN